MKTLKLTSIILVFILVTATVMQVSGPVAGLIPVSTAWAAPNCDADSDDYFKDNKYCRNRFPGPYDCDDKTFSETNDCSGSGGTTVFHVSVITENGTNPWSTASDPVNCAAYASADGKNYTAQFPRHLQCVLQCWISLSGDNFLTDDIALIVRSRKGRFIGLTIRGQDWIGGDGIMHESDQVPLDVPIPADISAGFIIPVNQDVTIHRLKGHLGGPRVEVAGVIHVGQLMYSPCILGSDCPSTGNSDYPDNCLQ